MNVKDYATRIARESLGNIDETMLSNFLRSFLNHNFAVLGEHKKVSGQIYAPTGRSLEAYANIPQSLLYLPQLTQTNKKKLRITFQSVSEEKDGLEYELTATPPADRSFEGEEEPEDWIHNRHHGIAELYIEPAPGSKITGLERTLMEGEHHGELEVMECSDRLAVFKIIPDIDRHHGEITCMVSTEPSRLIVDNSVTITNQVLLQALLKTQIETQDEDYIFVNQKLDALYVMPTTSRILSVRPPFEPEAQKGPWPYVVEYSIIKEMKFGREVGERFDVYFFGELTSEGDARLSKMQRIALDVKSMDETLSTQSVKSYEPGHIKIRQEMIDLPFDLNLRANQTMNITYKKTTGMSSEDKRIIDVTPSFPLQIFGLTKLIKSGDIHVLQMTSDADSIVKGHRRPKPGNLGIVYKDKEYFFKNVDVVD